MKAGIIVPIVIAIFGFLLFSGALSHPSYSVSLGGPSNANSDIDYFFSAESGAPVSGVRVSICEYALASCPADSNNTATSDGNGEVLLAGLSTSTDQVYTVEIYAPANYLIQDASGNSVAPPDNPEVDEVQSGPNGPVTSISTHCVPLSYEVAVSCALVPSGKSTLLDLTVEQLFGAMLLVVSIPLFIVERKNVTI